MSRSFKSRQPLLFSHACVCLHPLIIDPFFVEVEARLLLYRERQRDVVRATPLALEPEKLGGSEQPEIKR